MDFEISAIHKLKGIYNPLVFYCLIPRFILFPLLHTERYLLAAVALVCSLALNLCVITIWLPSTKVHPVLEALSSPVVSMWIALALCGLEQAKPGHLTE